MSTDRYLISEIFKTSQKQTSRKLTIQLKWRIKFLEGENTNDSFLIFNITSLLRKIN